MDMVTAAMQPLYQQIDEQNRKYMHQLFNRTGKVQQDDEDTDIVFGRNNDEAI